MQLTQMGVNTSAVAVLGRTLRPVNVIDILVDSDPFD